LELVYRLIVLLLLLAVLQALYEEKDLSKQANAALVIIPLVLRVLMIK